MKINPITNSSNFNYPLNQTNNANKSFKGIVNGKYYRDEVIREAKKALFNPNWRDKFYARKRDVGETLATWHRREGSNDLATRIFMGVATLGLTEVTWGLAHLADDASENRSIDKFIKEVEECMEDLGSGGGQR